MLYKFLSRLEIFLSRLFRNPANYKIVAGDHNRNTNEGTEQSVAVKRIISHPNYNRPRLSSDIALIQLASPVSLSQRVNPICIPSHDSDVPTGSKCYITGNKGVLLTNALADILYLTIRKRIQGKMYPRIGPPFQRRIG